MTGLAVRPTGRLGPRPLPLHLLGAMTLWQSSRLAWTLWRGGSPIWRPEFRARAKDLAAAAAGLPPSDLAEAIDDEIYAQAAGLVDAIMAYRRHPYRRALVDPPVLWRAGSTRLLDYGPEGGKPILVIPSLVNRAYVLDLTPDGSLLRWLAGQGYRPLLVDWGAPGPVERTFDLARYLSDRLEPALAVAQAAAGGPVAIAGYCMGGLLAVALALGHPTTVNGLALLTTPWDFHTDRAAASVLAQLAEPLASTLAPLGEVPADIVQSLFVLASPFEVIRKFARFAALDPASDAAIQFVATEDWASDGVALALPVLRETFDQWYGRNLPALGQWRLGPIAVHPSRFTKPALVLVARRDRLIAPDSAHALARLLPDVTVVEADGGHIGIVTSGPAAQETRQALAGWLSALDWSAAAEDGRRQPVRPKRRRTRMA